MYGGESCVTGNTECFQQQLDQPIYQYSYYQAHPSNPIDDPVEEEEVIEEEVIEEEVIDRKRSSRKRSSKEEVTPDCPVGDICCPEGETCPEDSVEEEGVTPPDCPEGETCPEVTPPDCPVGQTCEEVIEEVVPEEVVTRT